MLRSQRCDAPRLVGTTENVARRKCHQAHSASKDFLVQTRAGSRRVNRKRDRVAMVSKFQGCLQDENMCSGSGHDNFLPTGRWQQGQELCFGSGVEMNSLVDGYIAGEARPPGFSEPATLGKLFGKHDRDIQFPAGEQERLVPFQDFLDNRNDRNKPRPHVDNEKVGPVP